jgi:hypothetical protein
MTAAGLTAECPREALGVRQIHAQPRRWDAFVQVMALRCQVCKAAPSGPRLPLSDRTNPAIGAEAAAVDAALRDAGFMTERRDLAGGLADVFPGMGEDLAGWIVADPDGEQMMLPRLGAQGGQRPARAPPSGGVVGLVAGMITMTARRIRRHGASSL